MSYKFNPFTSNFDDTGDANTGITDLTGDVTATGPGSAAATISNGAVTDVKIATGIDAAKLADGTVSNTEFQFINSLASNAQTQIDSKVTGPASATDNAITRFDATTGKLVQNSSATIDDSGNITATNLSGSTSGTNTGDVTLAAFGSTSNANGASLTGQTLTLQPADATNPGGVTTGSQTLAGSKTFSSLINTDGGIDRSTSGTLTIGATNSTVINIGNSGATVNIQGTTIYENTPQLLVVDPLITLNSGGGAGSGQNSGIQIEEASSITGYAETSADRNSWILKAPNTAGIATITPGSGGITIDQSSHNPVTLTAVGAIPNANGASLSTQTLTLQPANSSFPGVLTAADYTTFSGTSAAAVTSLTGDVTGTGPGATATTVIMVGGATAGNIATSVSDTQAATSTNIASTIVKRDGSGNFSAGTITASLTGSASGNLAKATGDLNLTSFSGANNQSLAADVTGFAFANASVRAFKAIVSVAVDATSDLFEEFTLDAVQRGADWAMSIESAGDSSLVSFSITNSGQLQYVSGNYSGFVSLVVRFRALVTST